MGSYKEKAYKAFEMFDKEWAIVTAGDLEHYNSCTIGWGSFGNSWRDEGNKCSTITIYVHPTRYTSEFLKDNDYFTVSFYPEKYRPVLAYIGSHSGRDEDKTKATGLTPIAFGQSVTYKEANLTFLCKKIYQNQMSKDGLAKGIQDYYAATPEKYSDLHGGWQPHLMFIGEIIDAIDER